MFEKMLRDSPDEQWDLFFPVDGHWPTAEQFASYQVPTLTLTCAGPIYGQSAVSRETRGRALPVM